MKRTVTTEQYFTKHITACDCLHSVRLRYDLGAFDKVVEPSAGDGAFFNLLPHHNRVGIDTEPLAEGIEKHDFFQWTPPVGDILTIGNPPFGQRGSLAMAFLNRACEFSRVVAFILPRSFKKDTFMDRVNTNFHLVEQFDCSEFRSPDGNRVDVKAVFQIWEWRDHLRSVVPRATTHPDFSMRHAHLSRVTSEELSHLVARHDFAIAQVGSNFKPKEPRTLTAGSYWFIKANKPGVREVFERLDFSFLRGMNTAFTSLSKKDIIQAYCDAL